MRRRFWVMWLVASGLARRWPRQGGMTAKKARSEDVERILSVGHEESQVMDHLDVLCNRIGPRLTGFRQPDERLRVGAGPVRLVRNRQRPDRAVGRVSGRV